MSVSAANEDIEREVAEIGVRLLDDAYMTWRLAAVECEQAQRAWFEAPPRGWRGRYIAYQAAMDREEAAADDLERLSGLTHPCERMLAGLTLPPCADALEQPHAKRQGGFGPSSQP